MAHPIANPLIFYPTRLPHADIERLKSVAAAQHTRPATLAREAIQAYLDQQQIKNPAT
jgi:predicted transcriptional regulator